MIERGPRRPEKDVVTYISAADAPFMELSSLAARYPGFGDTAGTSTSSSQETVRQNVFFSCSFGRLKNNGAEMFRFNENSGWELRVGNRPLDISVRYRIN